MMTRREMLALMGSSAVGMSLRAQDAPFGRIDAHAHIHRSIPALIANMEKDNWRALTICVWEPFDNQLLPESDVSNFKTIDELLSETAKVHRESKGRIAWASTFDARDFENRDFTEKTIATVQQTFKDGAIGVKIWKTIGMKIRGKDGHFVLPDAKSLMPVYEAIQKQDRTLFAHIAEPSGAWGPPDAPGYWKQNPQWHAEPAGPTKEAMLEARDRILARYPKLRVVGAHLGSNEEDFKALAKRLDTYPNFSVDVSARTQYFFQGDPQTIRQFVDKYQDRLIYGSDFAMAKGTDDRIAAGVLGQENRQWSLFASNQKITQRNREIQGLGLPEPILRKLFHDNAVRMVPGIAPA